MWKIVLFLTLYTGVMLGDTALLLKKGWQLIGASTKITDMQIFDATHVEQLWHYDAKTQQWRGYSPQSDIAQKIKTKGYATIDYLESWHGFWVKSKDEWVLTLPQDSNSSDENITLQKGWNLISLPVDTVVSPHIFDKTTVWKYVGDHQWQLFDPDAKENFPTITHITNSDGIWVKSNTKQTISTVTTSAKLHNFSTVEAMEGYIKDMLLTYRRPYCGYYPLAKPQQGAVGAGGEAMEDSLPSNQAADANQKADNTSDTNLQEIGVDEADIIKHDNNRIFYLDMDPKNFTKMHVLVNTFTRIAANHLDPIQTIPIAGTAVDMYLTDNRLVVLSKYGMDNYKIDTPTPAEKIAIQNGADPSSMLVEIFDVSDLDNIHRTNLFKINGQLSSSRFIDDKLYLITRFSPQINITYPPIYVDAPECEDFFQRVYPTDTDTTQNLPDNQSSPKNSDSVPATVNSIDENNYKQYARCYPLQMDENGKLYRPDYEHPKITYTRLIPHYQHNDSNEKRLVTPENFYASDKKDQEPVITTVSQIDIPNGILEKTSSVLGYNNTIYTSSKSLYLVSNQYPRFYSFDRFEERSIIYRFNLGSDLGYQAAGFVRGVVLNQFSLSEYKDILRIATTRGSSWQNNTVNTLYTLKNIDDALVIQGVLSGLGKAGERIRAVRFLGDRGYIVTFKQTDPFYTLDLSDPARPKKVGELKIDGFSSYLHTIDEYLILGFGRDATPDGRMAGLKLELFSIADFTQPVSLDSYTLPGNYTRSEIEYNHKALAYRDSDHLLAFPYRLNQSYQYTKDYLGIFQIADDTIHAFSPLQSADSHQNYPYQTFQRGLIFDMDDKTYIAYFHNGKISYALLDNLKKE